MNEIASEETEAPTTEGSPSAPKKRKGGGQALDEPRGPAMFLMYPEDIRVVGGGRPGDPPADPTHPMFDERAVKCAQRSAPLWSNDMVLDIAENGVRVPVTVAKDERNHDEPTANAGRRRVLHATEANKIRVARGQERLRVKVIVEKGDAKTLFLMARRENAHRVQDDVLQRARNAQRAIEQFGALAPEVAASEGVNQKTVKEWLKLLELAPEAQEAIDLGKIAPTAALELLKDVPRKEQGAKLKEALAKGDVSVEASRAKAKGDKKKREAEASGANPDDVDTGEKPPAKGTLRRLLVHVSEAQERREELPLLKDDSAAEEVLKEIAKAKGDKGLIAHALQQYGITVLSQTCEWVLGDRSRKKVKGLSTTLRDAGVKD